MIQLYSWGTPNGYKPLIMLEEAELVYELIPVPLNGQQHEPAYTRINPNGKIPAIIDLNGPDDEEIVIFESGAILLYLAEKSGKFLPLGSSLRYEVVQWVMFQMAGIGPMFGQYFHFKNAAPEKIPYALERYHKEVRRLYAVLEHRLGESEYLAGAYSIADMASFPWVKDPEKFEIDRANFPNVARWLQAVGQRDAVKKALAITF